jgi:hypothetical protein
MTNLKSLLIALPIAQARARLFQMIGLTRPLFLTSVVVAVLQSPALTNVARAMTPIEQPPLSWGKDSSGAALTNEYFSTTANYGETRGTTVSLPAQNTYSTLTTHIRGRYGLSLKNSVFASIGGGYAQAVDPFFSRTNTALTDVSVGIDTILLQKRGWHILSEAQVGYPIDRVDPSQTTVLTSDGEIYLHAGLYYFKTFRYLRLGGYTGFYVPDQTAKRFDYEVTADFPIGRYFFAGLGLDGTESIILDSASESSRTTTTINTAAGSERYFAYNPALLEGRLWLGFAPQREIQVRLGYGQTLTGLHTAQGQIFLLSLVLNAPGPEDNRSNPNIQEHRSQDSAIKNFEADVEAVDPSLFRDANSPQDSKDEKKSDQKNR